MTVQSWSLHGIPVLEIRSVHRLGKIVDGIDIREGEVFLIRFEDGSQLSVSLREQDYTTPEAIYAHGFKDDVSFVV